MDSEKKTYKNNPATAQYDSSKIPQKIKPVNLFLQSPQEVKNQIWIDPAFLSSDVSPVTLKPSEKPDLHQNGSSTPHLSTENSHLNLI